MPSKKYEVKHRASNFIHKKKKHKNIPKISEKNIYKDIDEDYIYRLFPKSLSKYQPQIAEYLSGKYLNPKLKSSSNFLKENNHVKKRCEGLNKNKQSIKHKSNRPKRKSCMTPMQLSYIAKNKIIHKKYDDLTRNDNKKDKNSDKTYKPKLENDIINAKKKNSVKRGSLQNLSTTQLKWDKQFCSSTSSLGAIQLKKNDKTYA